MARFRSYSPLDKIRINEGNEKCEAAFNEICVRDIRRAAALLNDERLNFISLYILLPQIRSFQLERSLSPRIRAALNLSHIISGSRAEGHEAYGLSANEGAEYPALKWILETGREADGLSSEYEEIMDVAVSMLINVYKDITALPAAIDMIFKRNRTEHNIHYLVWAVFQSRSPHILRLIAERMVSSDPRDKLLAHSLLGIALPEDGPGAQGRSSHEAFLKWLKDNDPFLYFTGESLQYSSTPAFYRIDLERKYIHRSSGAYEKQPVMPADSRESEALVAFSTLGDEEKSLLSEYSHKMHEENISQWRRWTQRPVGEQIKDAISGRGSLNDYGLRFFV